MEASSTLEDIRPPVVSRRGRKVKHNCLRLQCHNILLYCYTVILLKYQLIIWNIADVVHVVKHNSVYNYLMRDTMGNAAYLIFFLLWMITIHYPNTVRSHLVTIVPMAPFTPKSTSKLRSALHIRYSKVILRFISRANTAQTY